jgi:hypothetical protein
MRSIWYAICEVVPCNAVIWCYVVLIAFGPPFVFHFPERSSAHDYLRRLSTSTPLEFSHPFSISTLSVFGVRVYLNARTHENSPLILRISVHYNA